MGSGFVSDASWSGLGLRLVWVDRRVIYVWGDGCVVGGRVVVGLQEDGFRVLSCVICVRSGCCIVIGRVLVGVKDEGYVLVSCEVCVQDG